MGIAGSFFAFILLVAYLVLIIVFIFRWWGMTKDIKEIKDILLKKFGDGPQNSYISNPKYDKESVNSEFERLKNIIKPNQCIILVKATNKMELWDKSRWEDVVNTGNKELLEMFELLYFN